MTTRLSAGRARAALLGGTAAWCLVALALTRTALDSLAGVRAGTPSVDQALSGLASAAGLLVLAWAAVAAGCTVAAVVVPAHTPVGRGARRAQRQVGPPAARRLLTLLVSAALVSGVAPVQALAPPSRAVVSTTGPVGSDDLDPGWGRPIPPAVTPASSALDPGWTGRPFPTPTTPTPVTPITPDPGPASSAAPASIRAPVTAHAPKTVAGTPVRRRPRASPDPIWSPVGRLRPDATAETSVVVRRGDTLWHVAARYLGAHATDAEIAASWPGWFVANRAVIGPDPDVLLPGQRLRPPSPSPSPSPPGDPG